MSENKIIWHPIEEGYPPGVGGHSKYLVTVKHGDIDIVVYSDDLYKLDKYDFFYYKNLPKEKRKGFFRHDSEFGFYTVDSVIAWAYLPEPYEDTENDEGD